MDRDYIGRAISPVATQQVTSRCYSILRIGNRHFTSKKAHRARHRSTSHSAHSASPQTDRPIALCQHLVCTPDSNAETAALVVCDRPTERLSQAPFSFLPSLVA